MLLFRKMAANKGQEAMKKMLQNSRGAGLGVGFLAAAGAAAYGVAQSIFTGSSWMYLLSLVSDV